MTPDILSLKEIETRYPDRWVLLDHVRADPGPVLRGGRVVFETTDEDEALRRLLELPDGIRYAIRYIGDPPADLLFAL